MKMEQMAFRNVGTSNSDARGGGVTQKKVYSEHGESLKSRILKICLLKLFVLLGVELPDLGGRVVFPSELNRSEKVKSEAPAAPLHEWTSLDPNTQQQLLNIIEQDTFTT